MLRLGTMLVLLVLAPAVSAQETAADDAEALVRATVTRLFDGMRAKDTTAILSTLHPSARLMTAANRDGERSVSESPIDAFLNAIVGAPVELDEQIPDDYPVLVDDGLAVAWTPYRFDAGGQFSHCGTNAFILARDGDDWQIVQIMDTRRRECAGEME